MPSRPADEVDLLLCAQEPIHIPGSIQPHGCLLAIDAATGKVLQVSANSLDWLGVAPDDLLGRAPADALPVAIADALKPTLRAAPSAQAAALVISGRQLDVCLQRGAGVVLAELTAATPAVHADGAESGVGRTLEQLAACREVLQFAGVLAEAVRSLTGFDRVVTYRFDVDGHGEVVAESKVDELMPYLGLHFPESDIPAQARELYLRNGVRAIADARYRPVPLVPSLRPDTGLPLDLSLASLRSVSPVHLEYMANMGVRASMSISLVVGGRLWGLVSAGHRMPRELPLTLRRACETIGRIASLQIGALEALDQQQRRESKMAPLRNLVERLRTGGGELLERLVGDPESMHTLARADGFAIVVGEKVHGAGVRPPLLEVLRLAQWLQDRALSGGVLQTRQLGIDEPQWASLHSAASGLLAFAMPVGARGCVMWFRGEQPHTVDWGGNPHKAVDTDPAEGPARLHPRKSFALWKEVVRGRAEPWTAAEVEAALELRRSAVEVDLAQQVARERAAVRARDDVVAVVSHDLRTPMSVVVMQAEIIQRLLGDKQDESAQRLRTAAQTIQRAGGRMATQLDELLDIAKIEAGRFAVAPQRMRAIELVQDARDLLSALAQAKGIALVVTQADDLIVRADPERIFQVFSNLIGNAIKFMPGGGRIEMAACQRGAICEFSVSDSGVGIAPDQLARIFDRYWQLKPSIAGGAGLGLYIAKGIVEAHGGTIRAESEVGRGTRFVFWLSTE